jgi:hypothetical protein
VLIEAVSISVTLEGPSHFHFMIKDCNLSLCFLRHHNHAAAIVIFEHPDYLKFLRNCQCHMCSLASITLFAHLRISLNHYINLMDSIKSR